MDTVVGSPPIYCASALSDLPLVFVIMYLKIFAGISFGGLQLRDIDAVSCL